MARINALYCVDGVHYSDERRQRKLREVRMNKMQTKSKVKRKKHRTREAKNTTAATKYCRPTPSFVYLNS